MNEIVYVKAIVEGSLPSGQKLVKLVASNTDGIKPFYIYEKDLVRQDETNVFKIEMSFNKKELNELLEKAIEQMKQEQQESKPGLSINLPININDTVYIIGAFGSGVHADIVRSIQIERGNNITIYCINHCFDIENIDETVFFTYEEAYQASKTMQEDRKNE